MSYLFSVCRNIFLTKVPFYALTILLLFSMVASYLFASIKHTTAKTNVLNVAQNAGCISSMSIIRLKDYELTKPVLLADINRESNDLEETKGVILDVIHQERGQANVSSVSVYLRKFTDGSWITINGDERFVPGSLMKVPILITYLKQAESDASLLNKQLVFSGRRGRLPHQNFVEDSLLPGVKYSIRELLRRMIVDSDNDATALLNGSINVALMQKLFTDLNLPEPAITQKDYFITASDCSKFLRILYNSSYLSNASSEFALDLLTQSKFKNGMTKDIMQDVKVAHKFGEGGVAGAELQLHEEGIVYVDNNPYLLVIMTKGKDYSKMTQSIARISKTVYDKFTGKNLN